MLNLDEISSFLLVAKAAGFTKASLESGLPKSTLSRHVQNLEERLALNLFQRSTRRLKLTAAGEDFFKKAQGLVAEFENLEKQFQSQSQKAEGSIKITCPVEVGVDLLPSILKTFKKKHPNVSFDLDLNDQTTNLIESKIDLAIRAGALEDSSIICKKLLTSTFKIFASQKMIHEYNLSHLKNLHSAPLIEYERKPFSKLKLLHRKKEVSLTQTPCFRSNSLRINAEMATAGIGVCALPYFMGVRYVQSGKLNTVYSELGTAMDHLHLLYPSQAHLPYRVRLFIDHLLSEINSIHLHGKG